MDMMQLAQQLTILTQVKLKIIHKLRANLAHHTQHHHLITIHPLIIEILTVNLPLERVVHHLRTILIGAIPLLIDLLKGSPLVTVYYFVRYSTNGHKR